MSKFCQNCGNMLDDSAAFCEKCGKPFEAAPQQAPQQAPQYEAPQYEAPQQAPQYEAPQYGVPQQPPQYGTPQQAPQYGTAAVAVKPNPLQAAIQFVIAKKKFFIAGVACLVVLIVLISIISSCAANSPKGALNTIVNKAKNLDIKGAANVSYDVNFDKDKDKDSYIKESEYALNMATSEQKNAYKKAMKDMKVEVKEDKKLSDDEMKSLVDSWSSSYKDTDKIKEIHELKASFSGSGLSYMNGDTTCYAVKVGGKWYIKGFGTSII